MRGGGIPLYVIATLMFFVSIGVWMAIGMYLGIEMWAFLVIPVIMIVVAAVFVSYIQSKDKDEGDWE